ncbi:hypothetical protein EVAR_49353_1 [Eumeta japonica]|uniref:Uncharacterized protein n=1 Tax=Eumeta variegata TaxID=151549 RepID=A0A4C1XYR1_EUMVA|nr:hypothetical protein EVAR_49353_1 [Eumeta japonica]
MRADSAHRVSETYYRTMIFRKRSPRLDTFLSRRFFFEGLVSEPTTSLSTIRRRRRCGSAFRSGAFSRVRERNNVAGADEYAGGRTLFAVLRRAELCRCEVGHESVAVA